MKVAVNNKSSCKVALNIEVDSEELKEEYAAVCSRFQKEARVPGFRRGKTPRSIIMQRFKSEIREDLLESSVQKHFLEAVEAEGLKPLNRPHVHDLTYADGEALTFTAEFEILPQLDISNYQGLEVERVPVDIKDEEVEDALEAVRQGMAQFVPVTGRTIENGDFAVISYTGKFADSDRKNLEAKDVYCEVGSENTLPEFNENLVGLKPGDSKSFEIKYPADFPNKDLASAQVNYELTVVDIRQKQVPDLNDDFAKDAGEYASVDDMRRKFREEIALRKEKAAQADMQEKLVELIIENNPFEVPEVMVKKQAENRLNDYARSLIMRGIHPQTLDINWAEFREKQQDLAVADVKVALVLEHIADRENISVSNEELDSDIAARAEESRQSFDAVKSRLTKDGAIDKIKDRLRNKKTLEFLLRRATLKDPQGLIVQP